MEALLLSVLSVGSLFLALVLTQHMVRKEPLGPLAFVLRSLTDTVLWSGVAAGATVMTATWVADSAAPWLTWSWGRFAIDTAVGNADSSIIAMIIMLAVLLGFLVVPVVAIPAFGPVFLLLTASAAHRRHTRPERHERTVLTGAATTAGFMAFGIPMIAAVLLGLSAAASGSVIRRFPHPRMAAAARSPENAPVEFPAAHVVWSESSRPISREWSHLPGLAQYYSGRVAGFHWVTLVTIAALMQGELIFAVAL